MLSGCGRIWYIHGMKEKTVLKLVRTGIGPLTLENLEIGKYRMPTHTELSALKNKPQNTG